METKNLKKLINNQAKQAVIGFGTAVILAGGLAYIAVIRPENIRQKEQIKLEQKLNNNKEYIQLKQEFKANQQQYYNNKMHQSVEFLYDTYLKKVYYLAEEEGLDTRKYVIKLEGTDIILEYKQSQ
jgi:hypothetical protein